MMKSFKPEILAPVGSYEMLIAAVRSGADAVYLGAENFNARRNAENFSDSDLAEAIKYCHIRNVKVYLTLNTALRDDEILLAVSTAKKAYTAGIDGVIVADLGLAGRLHMQFPKLSLHASTQMTVHSVSALPYLKKAGFTRVVISREMGKAAICEFTKAAREMGLETEVFVHGALCMSVSGQCLLSAVIGGRSGNRGLCAGPCRLPFESAGREYALSLKDLSLLEFASELRDMGVASLKIEGRMKRPEYVAAAVAAFKTALENGENAEKYAENLQNVFSRSGFTSGYYNEKLGADMFGIRTRDDVIASSDVLSQIHNLYRGEMQKIPLKMRIQIRSGEPICLTVWDGENEVTLKGVTPQKAQNKALEESGVKMHLAKLGGTPYFAESIEIELENGLFLAGAELNALRRNCIERLDELRSRAKPIEENEYIPAFDDRKPQQTALYCRFENAAQIPEKLDGVELITLPLECDISQFSAPENIKMAVELPRGILNEKQVAKRLEAFRTKGFEIAFCGTLAAKEIAENAGFKTVADIGFNIYNSETAKALEQSGAKALVLSPELRVEEFKRIKTPLKKGAFAYGRLPIMLTRNCPVKADSCRGCNHDRLLTDRMGIQFPVRCTNGFAEVFNSKPHYLADKKSDFAALDFMYLYFTFEARQEAAEIIDAYKTEKKPSGEFTRGLYYRGVQ